MSKTVLVYGIHAVQHAIRRAPERAVELWIQQEDNHKKGKTGSRKLDEVLALAEQAGLSWQLVPRKTLDKISSKETHSARHQGVILRQHPAQEMDESDLQNLLGKASSPVLLLVLDSVQDPHNLGACLRTAEAAGADAVIMTGNRGAGLSATVSKVASGAADSIPIIVVKNLARTLKDMQQAGVWLVGTSDQAEKSLYQMDLTASTAFIMGSEDKGIRRLTREYCDHLVHIPMAGFVESLNISVASGVCLFEAVRQRAVCE